MRDIRFRAWATDTKEMIGWDEVLGASDLYLQQKDPTIILMQYTGLKDKNGKEIYEGDLLQIYSGGGEPIEKERVHWNVGFSGFSPFIDSEFVYPQETMEVIGNIYENPELLKDN